ncbi:MAG TPA: DUF2784 family protein, partial [Elusimicrobiota bacterium]|nr:DUF2784 family protein [Elusimicrobiota bacterium]
GHLLLLWATVAVFVSGYYCPLTVMETSLRVHYDPSAAYAEGFVAGWLSRFLSWDLSRVQVGGATTLWAFFWTGIYVAMWRFEAKRKISR